VILAVVTTNTSKIERTYVLGRTVNFVIKSVRRFIGAMSKPYDYTATQIDGTSIRKICEQTTFCPIDVVRLSRGYMTVLWGGVAGIVNQKII
jgi:hypothetical protein